MFMFFVRSVMARHSVGLLKGRSFASCHLIESGARCQLWPPGTPVLSAFDS
jgi:hypothetical protein